MNDVHEALANLAVLPVLLLVLPPILFPWITRFEWVPVALHAVARAICIGLGTYLVDVVFRGKSDADANVALYLAGLALVLDLSKIISEAIFKHRKAAVVREREAARAAEATRRQNKLIASELLMALSCAQWRGQTREPFWAAYEVSTRLNSEAVPPEERLQIARRPHAPSADCPLCGQAST